MIQSISNKKRTYTSNSIYYIAFILSIIISSINETDIPNIYSKYNIVKYTICIICSLLYICKILIDHTSLRYLSISGITILLFLFVSVKSMNIFLPVSVLMIIAAKNISYLKIIKIYLMVTLSIFILTVIGSIIHIIPNLQYFRPNGGIRNSFGFNYPLAFSSFILSICIAYCILRYKNISWVDILFILFASLLGYKFTISQMNFYSSILLILLLILWRFSKNVFHKFPFSLSWLSLVVMTIFTLYYGYSYNVLNSFSYSLNKMLENRIYFSNYALNRFHISLFGQYIQENPVATDVYGYKANNLMDFYIDQSMTKLLLTCGLIVFLIVIIAYSYKMFELHLNHLDYFVVLFLVLVVCGFSDNKLFVMCYNPLLTIIFADLSYFKSYNYRKRHI